MEGIDRNRKVKSSGLILLTLSMRMRKNFAGLAARETISPQKFL